MRDVQQRVKGHGKGPKHSHCMVVSIYRLTCDTVLHYQNTNTGNISWKRLLGESKVCSGLLKLNWKRVVSQTTYYYIIFWIGKPSVNNDLVELC